MLRVILGGVLGLVAGNITAGLVLVGVARPWGYSRDFAILYAPLGGLLGMGAGAAWQLLRIDKKR